MVVPVDTAKGITKPVTFRHKSVIAGEIIQYKYVSWPNGSSSWCSTAWNRDNCRLLSNGGPSAYSNGDQQASNLLVQNDNS